MSIYRWNNISPQIGVGVFIAENAIVSGDVTIGNNTSIWFQSVLRGDDNKIVIGENVNVQDLSMLHVNEYIPLIIEDNVSIGHHVVLHACTIKKNCLIGMGAIVLDGAVINENSVVAAGSVVPPGKTYPPYTLIMGNPAVAKRALTEEEKNKYGNHYKGYLKTKETYLDKNSFQQIQ